MTGIVGGQTPTNSVPPAPSPEAVAVLSGRLTINEAETVRDHLLRHLAASRRLTLETAALETVDVAGLQLLISARRSAERIGGTVRLAAPPAGALLTALVAAGFRSAGDQERPDAIQDGFWWGKD